MKLRSLTYLLLLLLTLQSTAGLADMHAAHQSAMDLTSEEHHYTIHEHSTYSIDSLDLEEHDCSHCGHCHGHSTLAIPHVLASEACKASKKSSLILGYSETAFPDWYEAFLRPPIS